MAQGFVGKAANSYARMVQTASRDGSACLASVGGGGGKNVTVHLGSANRTGVGTSENIVVDDNLYRSVLGQIEQADRKLADNIQYAVQQMENLCRDLFIVPETTPKVERVLDAVKNSMSEFRDLTTQTTRITDMYVSEIMSADSR